MSLDAGFPMFTPPDGGLCVLEVGAQCDGPEDCGAGQTCCGTYDPLMLTYTRVGCSESCSAPNLYPFCHASDECAEGLVCRRSRILPHEFVAVCAPPPDVPAAAAASAVAGRITCGETTCEVGVEHCCLAAEFVFQQMSAVALAPYCAPLDVPCSCEGRPADVDAGGDPGSDPDPDAG
jgi:hypothetical protein